VQAASLCRVRTKLAAQPQHELQPARPALGRGRFALSHQAGGVHATQTLLELAQRDIGGIVQLPGRALVLLLGLQPAPPPAQALPPAPLLISGYIVQRNEMPP
jgi:hypothetical protein